MEGHGNWKTKTTLVTIVMRMKCFFNSGYLRHATCPDLFVCDHQRGKYKWVGLCFLVYRHIKSCMFTCYKGTPYEDILETGMTHKSCSKHCFTFFSKSKHWRQSSKTTGQLCLFYVADMFCIYNSFPSPQGLVIHAYPLWELSLDLSSFSKSWRTINESPNNRDSGFAGWVQSLVRHTLKLSFLFIYIGYFKIFKLK